MSGYEFTRITRGEVDGIQIPYIEYWGSSPDAQLVYSSAPTKSMSVCQHSYSKLSRPSSLSSNAGEFDMLPPAFTDPQATVLLPTHWVSLYLWQFQRNAPTLSVLRPWCFCRNSATGLCNDCLPHFRFTVTS